VVIINRGKIEAADTPENLVHAMRAAGGIRLEAKVGADDGVAEIGKLAGVKEVTVETEDSWSVFTLRTDAHSDPREELWRLATDRHWTVRELSRRRATLEDVFVEMTLGDDV